MRAVVLRAPFDAHPLAWLAGGFAVGVCWARACAPPSAFVLAAGAVGYACAWAAWRGRKATWATGFVLAGFVLAGAALALVEVRAQDDARRVRRWYEDGRIEADAPVELTGVLASAPEVAPDGAYLALRVERLAYKTTAADAAGTVELFAPARDAATRALYEALELRRGARVRVLVVLARGAEFRNPGAGAPAEFLARRGFDAAGTIKSPLLVERLDDERVLLPLVWLDGWREWLRARLARLFAPETAGVLQAALLGNRRALTRATAERFRDGGTFHVLVISGLHISFIGWLAFAVLRRLTRRRAVQFVASAALLWAYTVAVGAEASVVRAALTFTLVALAPLAGRRASALNALGAAALALLVWQPSDLFDPSFQLTFGSVVAIVTLAWPLLTRLEACGAWRPKRATPYPPACPHWFRTLGETLYWRERAWRRETARNAYSYRLFKTTAAARLERWRVQWLLRQACGAFVVSASVQLVLLPALVVYFHRVSVAALVLNVFVGALMAALGLVALGAVALSALSVRLAAPLVYVGERLDWLMTNSVEPFARLHVAALRLPAYHGPAACVYALYYLPLAALLVALARWQPLAPPEETTDGTRPNAGDRAPARADEPQEHSRSTRVLRSISRAVITRARSLNACAHRANNLSRRAPGRVSVCAGLAFAALLCVVVTHPRSAARPDGRLRVDFLDVGQGDAALVTLPDGTTLLVDGGGRPDFDEPETSDAPAADDEPASFTRDARGLGDVVVSEYLWWRGLAGVDYVLATHAHADHAEGLNAVARNFAVRAAFVGRAPTRAAEYAQLAATMRAEGVPVLMLARGARLRFGAVEADVLWPPPDARADAPSGNDDSVVLRLRYGARTFLLTGDMEGRAETALVGAGEDLRCDVLKVAHHGSRTSSTPAFVNATRPAVAVISVGRTSPFGHPDPNVVARWLAAGAQVLQTGRRGTITVSTDGRDLRVETYVRE
ncbi:MAG TPA: ComEC/Rec2 family competence protein [Pyrinomonadaceae bacterium]|jgi:competence protein ComEC